MKEVLRQLLEAEEAGRRTAAALEAEGEQLSSAARAESERIVHGRRAAAAQEIAELEGRVRADTARRAEDIARAGDAEVEKLREQAAARRQAAVPRVVAMLLGEECDPE